MKLKKIFLIAIAILVASTPSAEGKAGKQKARHVIFIGLDGWGAYSVEKADIPNIKKLMGDGAYSLHKRSVLPSSSAVNWASMFMGAGPELHGYTEWGSQKPELPSRTITHYGMFPSVFGLLRDAYPQSVIGYLYEWDGMKFLAEQEAMSFSLKAAQDSIAMIAYKYIAEARPTLFAIIYDDPDHTGHVDGHDTPAYYNKLKVLDNYIGQIVKAVKDAGMEDETIFILTSDHGGVDKGHGGKTMLEMETPFIISGKNIKQGIEIEASLMQYDIAATIAAIFGLEQPQVWTGRPAPVFRK